jgi:hypothetical protein
MNIINDDLLLQFAKYCDIYSLNQLTIVNTQLNNLRLYRLYMGHIAVKEFGIDSISDIKYYKEKKMYNLAEYIKDIHYSLHLPNETTHIEKKIIRNMGKASIWYGLTNFSYDEAISYWRNNKYKEKKIRNVNLCKIYRIPLLIRKIYQRKYGFNLLALIY